MTDQELVNEMRSGEPARREAAFAELVACHVHWMYAAAIRMVGDPHAAEDVVQAAFMVLAAKVNKITGKVRLTSWLATTVRLAALRAKRDVARRRHHETKSQMNTPQRQFPGAADQAEWNEIAPILDGAVARLGQVDREAILLRFYRQLSFPEVGASLGVSEEAARKRVDRALKQMRPMLGSAGVVAGLSDAALGALLLGHSTAGTAPAGLIAASTILGLTTTNATALAGPAGVLAKSVTATLALIPLKIVAALLVIFIACGTVAAIVRNQLQEPTVAALKPSPSAPIALGPDPTVRPPSQWDQSPQGRLKNGVSIALLGIADSPSDGRTWFAADGTPLGTPPYAKADPGFWGPIKDAHEYAFAPHPEVIGTDEPATIIFPYVNPGTFDSTAVNPTLSAAPAHPMLGNDKPATDRLAVTAFDAPGTPITLQSKVAAGPWTTRLVSRSDRDVSVIGNDGFNDTWFARPAEINGWATTFETFDSRYRPLDQRIVAIDTDGKIHQTNGLGFNSGYNGFYSYQELAAPHLPLARLARFELQTRPFDQWIEFSNLTSDPRQPTHVEVRTSDDPLFKARLPSGTSVTLLGVSNNTDANKVWWNADGSPLRSPDYVQLYNHLGASGFQLQIMVRGTDALGNPWTALNMRWSSSTGPLALVGVLDNGHRVPGRYALLGQRSADQRTTTLTLAFAAQPYKIGMTLPIDGVTIGMSQRDGDVGDLKLSNPREVDGHGVITAQIGKVAEGVSVIVAAQHGRQVLPPAGSPRLGDNRPHDVQFSGPLKSAAHPDGIDVFLIETRNESASVEFKDICLDLNSRSTPTVIIHSAPEWVHDKVPVIGRQAPVQRVK